MSWFASFFVHCWSRGTQQSRRRGNAASCVRSLGTSVVEVVILCACAVACGGPPASDDSHRETYIAGFVCWTKNDMFSKRVRQSFWTNIWNTLLNKSCDSLRWSICSAYAFHDMTWHAVIRTGLESGKTNVNAVLHYTLARLPCKNCKRPRNIVEQPFAGNFWPYAIQLRAGKIFRECKSWEV